MKKQMRILYSGRVQGVGFRMAARQTAQGMGVNGWVRNLSDGRVELLLEAEEDILRAYFKKLNQSFTNYILDYKVEWFPASGKYNGFSVKI